MKKRFVALVLALLMLMTVVPVPAMGAQNEENSSQASSLPFVSYLQTEIEADRVVNYGGYASISLEGLGKKTNMEEMTVIYTERQSILATATILICIWLRR